MTFSFCGLQQAALALFGLGFALTFGSIASAQTAPAPPVNNSRAVPAPDPYEDDPAADPSRPTVTNPAHIPPPGYLQFEQGFLQANTTPRGGPDSQFSLVQSTKIALNHYVMPFVLSQPYAYSNTGGQGSNDPGDIDLGLQVVMFDEGEGHSLKPTVAVSYINRVRAGTSANLDVGGYKRSMLLLASGNVGVIHYDTNFVVSEQEDTDTVLAGGKPQTHNYRRAQFGQTLSLTYNFTDKYSLSGEIWRFSQPLQGGNAIGNLYAFGYTPRKTLVLDAGFSRGLTGTSTSWETFAGFTYLLPHRLWKRRQ
jgi:hypothetical protein